MVIFLSLGGLRFEFGLDALLVFLKLSELLSHHVVAGRYLGFFQFNLPEARLDGGLGLLEFLFNLEELRLEFLVGLL